MTQHTFNLLELPRILSDDLLEDIPDAGWQAVRNKPQGNIQGLNTGLVDCGFFLVGPTGERIVGSDQGGTLNEGIRGFNSGDSFLDRAAAVRIPGSDHIFHLRITGNRSGHVIHADGRVIPMLVTPDRRAHALVRLIGWADFGRSGTFNERFPDGRRRFVPEPQPPGPVERPLGSR